LVPWEHWLLKMLMLYLMNLSLRLPVKLSIVMIETKLHLNHWESIKEQKLLSPLSSNEKYRKKRWIGATGTIWRISVDLILSICKPSAVKFSWKVSIRFHEKKSKQSLVNSKETNILNSLSFHIFRM
jgi:hypothetical protein